MRSRPLLWFPLAAGLACAQNFSVPSNWKNTTTSLNREARQTLARGAADALLVHFDASEGTVDGFNGFLAASLVSVLSLQDYLSGNTTNKETVEASLQVYGQKNADYFYLTPDPIYWGLASIYAYRAYQDSLLLNLAESLWNLTSSAFITADQATSYRQPSRSVSIKPSCDAPSIAGGVFWNKDVRNATNVNGETIGPWLTLSAYLYETTGSKQYLTAAQLSSDFMQLHMMNPGRYIYDTYDPVLCTLDNSTIVTYNSGWFIEGMSVLANVTQNSTQAQMLFNLVSNVVSESQWTLFNGVNSEVIGPVESSAGALKGALIRGLLEMRNRFANQTQLASLVESYITVQFNAIMSNARAGSTDDYTASWTGPAPSEFQAAGNVVALDVFNAMFSFAAPANQSATNSTSSPSSTKSASPSTPQISSNTGAIVGGVVGGLGGIALLVGILFCFFRRHRLGSHASNFSSEKFALNTSRPGNLPCDNQLAIEPFLSPYALSSPSASNTSRYAPRSGKQERFAESLSDSRQILSGPSSEATAVADLTRDGRTVSLVPAVPTAATDAIPDLVSRLQQLLHRAEAQSRTNADELPPAYGI